MAPLFGKEILRPIGWLLLPMSSLGILIGLALGAVAVWPAWRRNLDSSLVVFSRGLVSVMALSTLVGSSFTLLLALLILFDSPLSTSAVAVLALSVLPSVAALLFAAELGYAATLYRAVHQRKKDGLSRALSVSCAVLVVPAVIVAFVFGGFGVDLVLTFAKVTTIPGTLGWGLGGILLSALLGVGGFALALSGKIKSTAAVLGRGATMLLSIGIFVFSGVLADFGAQEIAKAHGMPVNPDADLFAVLAVIGMMMLLLTLEFGLGAVLHWDGSKSSGSSLQRWLGHASVTISGLCGIGATLVLALAAIISFAP